MIGLQQGSKGSQTGMTMLELLLILVVAALLAIFSLKSYQAYENFVQLQQLRYNVNQLLEAAAGYYQANCATGGFSPNPPSFLSPYPNSGLGLTYPPATTDYFSVSINSILEPTGYLDNSWNPSNPLVDPSGGESGYVVQLNPLVASGVTVNACVVLTPGTECVVTTPVSTVPAGQAQMVTWSLQVAVKIKNLSQIKNVVAALGATCISGQTAGSSPATVDPCPSVNASQNYVVWTRIPSYATVQKSSPFIASMFLLKQNNLQYTHDQNYEMNAGYSTTTTPSQAPVYYLCGG